MIMAYNLFGAMFLTFMSMFMLWTLFDTLNKIKIERAKEKNIDN